MEILIAVSKINKHLSDESGDTIEVIERPNGGISVVMSDSQSPLKGSKVISSFVVRKVISLLADGIRDSAAARAASDYLYTEKDGQISASLGIISVDIQTNTIVISRNGPTPVYIARHDTIDCLGAESPAIGTSRNIKPAVCELPLEVGRTVIMYTDGFLQAGETYGKSMDVPTIVNGLLEDQDPHPQVIADTLLAEAIRLDQNRPTHDMTVVVLKSQLHSDDQIRRLFVKLPIA